LVHRLDVGAVDRAAQNKKLLRGKRPSVSSDLGSWFIAEQKRRLAHARAHADLVLDTNEMTAEEVWKVVGQFLGLSTRT